MCVPACTQKIAQDLNRRSFLRAAVGAAALVGGGSLAACQPISATMPVAAAPARGFTFSRLVDLTHTITPDFPTFFGQPQFSSEQLTTLDNGGYNSARWTIDEHTGTHMDSPFHFSDGPSADLLPADVLHGPLAIVDIRTRAQDDADTQLTPDDILAWEAENGPLPEGAIVAMLSGWEQHVATATFRNADDAGGMHFPGFHIEAIELLLGERNVNGIFVDTLSLDFGASADFAVHYRWLPAGKWGIECAANLGALPAAGAHAIVGGPKIGGASGGPSRLFALL